MANRKTTQTSSVPKTPTSNPPEASGDGQSPNFERDQEIMSNETLSDVNQLNAFGGDRPHQDLVDDESLQQ